MAVGKNSHRAWDLGYWNDERNHYSFEEGAFTVFPKYLPERGRFVLAQFSVGVDLSATPHDGDTTVGTEASTLHVAGEVIESGGYTNLRLAGEDVAQIGWPDLDAAFPGGVGPGDRVHATLTVEYQEEQYLQYLDSVLRDRLRAVECSLVTFPVTVEGFEPPAGEDDEMRESVAVLAVGDRERDRAGRQEGARETIRLQRDSLPHDEDFRGARFRCSLVHLDGIGHQALGASPYLSIARVEGAQRGGDLATVTLSDRDGQRRGTLELDGDRLPPELFETDDRWLLGIRLVPER